MYITPCRMGGATGRAVSFISIIALTLCFVVLAAVSALAPAQQNPVAQLRLLGLVLFRVSKGRAAFARANPLGGRLWDWIVYGGAIVVFLALETGLNALFQLGKAVDLDPMAAQLGMAGSTLVIVLALQTILEGSLIGLVIAFGEEYGWRAFLQGQLTRLGKKRGVLIVGLIWGAWHYLIIWMGSRSSALDSADPNLTLQAPWDSAFVSPTTRVARGGKTRALYGVMVMIDTGILRIAEHNERRGL
ncbi:MAG: CPBP family intramembrane metalloprotease [Chloroflexi bacterium]|nr:CPBP family intramembrane metalloprotease [Chloroflexota bacterium]